MASTETISSMMDESLIATEQHTQISPVLMAMGIKMRNEHCNQRLKNALDDFNAHYLNAMEFLTQILPVAKQQFGKKDNVLLPKTPGKKRQGRKIPGRAHLVDISELSALDDSDFSIKPMEDATTAAPERVVDNFVILEKPAAKAPRGMKKKGQSEKKIKLDPGSEDKENHVVENTAPFRRTTRSCRNRLVVQQLEPKKNKRRACSTRKKVSDERIEEMVANTEAAVCESKKASENPEVKAAEEERVAELDEIKPRQSSLRSSSGGSGNECKRVSFGDDHKTESKLKRSSSSSSMKPDAKRPKAESEENADISEVPPSLPEDHCVSVTSDKGKKRKSVELTGPAKKARCDTVEEKLGVDPEEEKPSMNRVETNCNEDRIDVGVDLKVDESSAIGRTGSEVGQSKYDSDNTKSAIDQNTFEINHTKSEINHSEVGVDHSKFEIDHSKIGIDQSQPSDVDHTASEVNNHTKSEVTIGKNHITINLATPKRTVATPKRIVCDTFVSESPINVKTEPQTPLSELLALVTPSIASSNNGASQLVIVETPDISKVRHESTFASVKADNGLVMSSSSIASEYGTPSQTTKQSDVTSGDGGLTTCTNPIPTSEVSNTNKVRRSRRSSVRRVVSSSHGIRRSSRRISARQSKRSSAFKKPRPTIATSSSASDSEACCSLRQGKTDTEEVVSPITKTTSTSDDHETGPTTSTPDVHIDEPSSDSGAEEDLKTDEKPATSTPDIMKPRRSLRLTKKLSLKAKTKKVNGSVLGKHFTPKAGKVAGIIREINDKNSSPILIDKQSSMYRSPAGNSRFFSPVIKRSMTKPSNIVGGEVRSFINRPVSKKVDPNELARMKKLELLRKQEKEKERVDQAEQRRKIIAEEHKRKREEKQKRVNEAKAAREKEEQEKKLRQIEEKKHLLQALEQAKKKKEQEEENKKKIREQRKKEADARRLKENEERMKRIQEKEEEERLHRELLRKKQEHDEQERKQRIQEEKRLQEQKQRERLREKEEERERKLREIKEKEADKMKEEAERKEKERKQKEAEDREKKRIALLIKERMEKEKRAREEKERRDREELAKRLQATKVKTPVPKTPVAPSPKPVVQTKSVNSYAMTPPYGHKPPTDGGYNLEELRSDDSTDDEDCPRQKVPQWAQGIALKNALLNQDGPRKIFTEISRDIFIEPPKLEEIFVKKRRRFFQRTSSAHWDTPPIKKICT